jgi:hypothetical protein
MSVIPNTWEAEVGGSWSKTSPGKKHETLSKTKLKQKGLGMWFKW